jgi:hypothetical protein
MARPPLLTQHLIGAGTMSDTKPTTSGKNPAKRHRTAKTFTPTDRAVFERLLIQMAALKDHEAKTPGCKIICSWATLSIPEAIRSQHRPIEVKASEWFYVEAANAFDGRTRSPPVVSADSKTWAWW